MKKIFTAIDRIAEAADSYHGMFPSMLDRETGLMLKDKPEKIPGQRDGDRAMSGSNLIHDQPLLRTMNALSAIPGKENYAKEVDRYLERFATHCTNTVTGLFPWGEHSFWNLIDDCIGTTRGEGNAIHDHLRKVPVWIWEKLAGYNPKCVQRFADGIEYHWVDCEPREYIRHAPIEKKEHYKQGGRSCDFPRHSGLYLIDLAFAYAIEQRQETLERIQALLDYWWQKKDKNGLLQIESRSPVDAEAFYQKLNPPQTISLAVSLLDAGDIIEETDAKIAETMRQRGVAYLNGFLSAPHEPEKGLFVGSCMMNTYEVTEKMTIWGSKYGSTFAGTTALMCVAAFRKTNDGRYLEWAEAAGREYLKDSFPPVPGDSSNSGSAEAKHVPAGDAGYALGLLADLYDITGDDSWIKGAMKLADQMTGIYLDKDLPRGASGIDWYESQLGPAFLLHGLARVALLAENRDTCVVGPDYTGR